MLYHPTLEKLAELRLTGMRAALLDQQDLTDIERFSFEERLGLLLDREATFRAERRLKYRLRNARLRQAAAIEDLDYLHPRGLDRALMGRLIEGQWIPKTPQPARHRPHRRRQDLDRLRARQQGPAATASPSNTIVCRGCSMNSAMRTATAATRKWSRSWPEPMS